MKNLIFIFFTFFCYSQEDNTCKELGMETLQISYNSEKNFNSYHKNGNACIDAEYPIKANYNTYISLYKKADEMFLESSIDSMFNIIRSMNRIGLLNNSDLSECSYDKILFNLTYITSDRKRIEFRFMLKYLDIVKIKNSLNRQDLINLIVYIGKY